MACTAITPARFKVLKPSFAAVADATVQAYIDLAQLWAADWPDDLCEPVQAAVTCHLMTLDGLGASADAVAMASGEAEYQTIKTGTVSLTRFRSAAEGAGQSTNDWFVQTACGRQFLVYVRMMKGAPRAAIGQIGADRIAAETAAASSAAAAASQAEAAASQAEAAASAAASIAAAAAGSADSAAASKTAAAASAALSSTKAGEAASSATSAAASASEAEGSAIAAAESEAAAESAKAGAALSATQASGSATSAATSAATATASKLSAIASAESASISATAAANSQAEAAASADDAADSETAAASSAAAAAGSATAAAASKTAAEASEANAAGSATAAAASEGAAAASATASAASAAQSEISRVYADASASAAQSARDAAFVNANVFADIATGRAAVADGQQFQVATGDEIIRYRRDSSSTQTEVARYPAGQTVVALDGALGQIAAILGQAYEEVDRLSAAQEGDVYTLRTLLEALSLIGQIARQINGGQVALLGGSLADPALRIGTVGVYSSAADTLSVAIAGSEVARFTASGLTVYGTVTEA